MKKIIKNSKKEEIFFDCKCGVQFISDEYNMHIRNGDGGFVMNIAEDKCPECGDTCMTSIQQV